jgi:hypothetical protein
MLMIKFPLLVVFTVTVILLTGFGDDKKANQSTDHSTQADKDIGLGNAFETLKELVEDTNNIKREQERFEQRIEDLENHPSLSENRPSSFIPHTFKNWLYLGVYLILIVWLSYSIYRFFYYFRTKFIDVSKIQFNSPFNKNQQRAFREGTHPKLVIIHNSSLDPQPNCIRIKGGEEMFVVFDHFQRHADNKQVSKTPWKNMFFFLMFNKRRWGFTVNKSCELYHPNLHFSAITIDLADKQVFICNPAYIYAHSTSVSVTAKCLSNKIKRLFTSLPLRQTIIQGPGKVILGCEGGLKVDDVWTNKDKTLPVLAVIGFTGNVSMRYQADTISKWSLFLNFLTDAIQKIPLFNIPFINVSGIVGGFLRFFIKPVPKDLIRIKLDKPANEFAQAITAQITPKNRSLSSGAEASSNGSLVNVSLINT